MPVAFITGAGQGIGQAIALRLAKDGYDISVNDIPSKDVTAVVEAVKAIGRNAIAAPADVTSAEEIEAAVFDTVRKLGGIDVMVANAGIWHVCSFLELTPQKLDDLIGVNLIGVYNCFQSAAKEMIRQGRGGRLLAASSSSGKVGSVGRAGYSATKFAVRGMTQSVAQEMGKYGITANCYCPSVTDTPMLHDQDTGKMVEFAAQIATTLPIPRVGQPEDVANLVSFLASERASFITGKVNASCV